jgi:hypothetical protein
MLRQQPQRQQPLHSARQYQPARHERILATNSTRVAIATEYYFADILCIISFITYIQ